MDLGFEHLPRITAAEAASAMDAAAAQIRRNLVQFTYSCQNHTSVDLIYPPCENNQWTCGFWPGEIWLAYEYTGEETLKYAGLIQAESFLERIEQGIEVDHHDMGFLYTPSCVAAYKITGNRRARKAALLAADNLIKRFQPAGEFLQAWGELGAADNYRYIIDCLLNLPLLYWAGSETGNAVYRQIAYKHITTCLKYSIREDGSTYHTVFMDPKDGSMLYGATCQGYKDDSFWARGQAWAIYGTALSYRYTQEAEYYETFNRLLDFYLAHLPKDMVPYWDMVFQDGSDEPRDSSSAAIVACGLLEMGDSVEEERERYQGLAQRMLKSLADTYQNRDQERCNGLLLHATYSKKSPYNTCTEEGVDECAGWGDYFYMEALTRLQGNWNPYW